MSNKMQEYNVPTWIIHGVQYMGEVYEVGGQKILSSDSCLMEYLEPLSSPKDLELEMYITDECNSDRLSLNWIFGLCDRSATLLKDQNPIKAAKALAEILGDEVTISTAARVLVRVAPDGSTSTFRKLSDFYLDIEPERDEFSNMAKYL